MSIALMCSGNVLGALFPAQRPVQYRACGHASPHFTEDTKLARFDNVIANPPFSPKAWSPEKWSTDAWGRNLLGGTPSQTYAWEIDTCRNPFGRRWQLLN